MPGLEESPHGETGFGQISGAVGGEKPLLGHSPLFSALRVIDWSDTRESILRKNIFGDYDEAGRGKAWNHRTENVPCDCCNERTRFIDSRDP